MRYWAFFSLTLAGLAADQEPTNWRQMSGNQAWGIRRGSEGWGRPGGGFRQEFRRQSWGMTSYRQPSPIRPQMIFMRPEKLSRSAPIKPVSARRPEPAR